MIIGRWPKLIPGLLLVMAALLVLGSGFAVTAQPPVDRAPLREPVYRVPANQPVALAKQASPQAEQAVHNPPAPHPQHGPVEVGQVNEHVLMPAIRRAKEGIARIDRTIHDYTCLLVKRENVDGTVGDYEFMNVKVRHKPFSVYLQFVGPAYLKGRECIYVEGKNGNKLIAHEGGGRIKNLLPTVRIDPTSTLAMRNQRYAITEIGIRNLTARLVEVAEQDTKYGECDVKFYKGAKIKFPSGAERICTCIQVVHPHPRKNFRFHLAQVFIDDEMQIPIRFQSYDWPAKQGEPPILLEEYTYMDLKINTGLTDADFDEKNENYKF